MAADSEKGAGYGKGTFTSCTGTNPYTPAYFENPIAAECASHIQGDTTDSKGAKSLSGNVKYVANYQTSSDTNWIYINWDISWYEEGWDPATKTAVKWTTTYETATVTINAGTVTATIRVDDTPYTGTASSSTLTLAAAKTAIRNACTNYVNANGYSGKRVALDDDGTVMNNGTITGKFILQTTVDQQVFKSYISAKIPKKVKLAVTKQTKNETKYTDLVTGNPNYSLNGTTFDVYTAETGGTNLGTITITADAGATTSTSSTVLELDSSYANTTVYLEETKAGKGYIKPTKREDVTLGAAGATTTATIDNIPSHDPVYLQLNKQSNVNYTSDFNGTILANGARYTVEYYYTKGDLTNADKEPVKKWIYETKTYNRPDGKQIHGYIDFGDPDYLSKNNNGNLRGDDPYYDPDDSSWITFPIGYYKIYESRVPKQNGVETGLGLSDKIWRVGVTQASNGAEAKATIYNNSWNSIVIEDYGETSPALAASEEEQWYPLGLVKVDSVKHTGYANHNDWNPRSPQGDASLKDSVWGLYTSDSTIFDSLPNKTYNNTVYGVDTTAPITQNGVTVYPIKVNNVAFTMTTNSTGYGNSGSSVLFPYGDCYYVKELVAPKGYNINNSLYNLDKEWTSTDTDGNTTIIKYAVYGSEYSVIGIDNNGVAPESIKLGAIKITKKDMDLNASTAQGDATLEGIKYAIVNRSTNAIVRGDTQYNPGYVVDIAELPASGTITLTGFPFGTYGVYELRSDTGVTVGANYDTANKGTSLTSNGSYAFNSKNYDSVDVNAAEFNVDPITKQIYDSTTGELIVGNVEFTYSNQPVKGNIYIQKLDAETDLLADQGINTRAGIRYAVINRSAKAVYYNEKTYAPGTVIAVVSLNNEGKASLTNVPYGRYEVHELRMDATITAGEVYNGSAKLGTSIYANEYYIYCDNFDTKIVNKNTPTYTVEYKTTAVTTISTIGQNITHTFKDAPVRSDASWHKVDNEGYDMKYVPFLISRLDSENRVMERHVIVTDANGIVNTETRGNKTPATVNILDKGYKTGGQFVLPDGMTWEQAAAVNVWFGTTDKYGANASKVIANNRGSFIYGTYLVEELMCENNEGVSLISSHFTIVEDNINVEFENIFVDPTITMISEALDLNSQTKSLTISPTARIKDDLVIDNLKVYDADGVTRRQYGVVTEVVKVAKDGTTQGSLGVGDMYEFIPEPSNNTNTTTAIIPVEFTIDTSSLQPGESVALIDRLYTKVDGQWTTRPIAEHNTRIDHEAQKLYVPIFSTDAVNDVTRCKIGSLDPNTVANDTITYKGLGDHNLYTLTIELVDDDGNVINDVNGNPCSISPQLYINEQNCDEVMYVEEYGVLVGPTTATFKFGDFIDPFVVENGHVNAHFVLTLKDLTTKDLVMTHNVDRKDANETISWIQIGTVASSVTGYEGIIPNAEDAELVDKITYTNCVQTVDVRIDGTIVEQETGATVSENSITQTLTVGEGETEMRFKFDSTPYAGKKLVVFERVYMNVDGKDVLIAEHADINDEKQTVMVPEIHTTLANVHEGTGYKVVSQEIEDVKLVDYVEYNNLIPGDPWTLTATLMDKNTGEPVVDVSGNSIQVTHDFVPEESSGVEPVEFNFKRLVKSIDWEIDESWVCFENLKPGTPGHDQYDYAVHADLEDKNQEVKHPKFKTLATSESGTKYIMPEKSQKVIDTVTLRNFAGSEELEISNKFTLKIEAMNASTGQPILDDEGNPAMNTKTFEWTGQKEETIECVFDATELGGQTIVFFETLYFGESTDDSAMVLREDDLLNADQSVSIPDIHTTARDKATNTKIVSKDRILVDDLTMEGIMPNQTYTITTKVVDKDASTEDNIVFLKDANGKDIEATVSWTSPASNKTVYQCACGFVANDEATMIAHTQASVSGNSVSDNSVHMSVSGNSIYKPVTVNSTDAMTSVEIDIKNVASPIEGKDLVVFEYMYLNGVLYASHADLNDLDQTVEVPGIRTKAKDKADGDNVIDGRKKKQTIIDTVMYSNLVVGQEYTVTGTLVVKPKSISENKDYTYVKGKDGDTIVSTVKFTPTSPNGTVDVPFTIDASKYAGKTLVAFEKLIVNDYEVAVHADLDDIEQTIYDSLQLHVKIAKTDKDNIQYFLKGAEITLYTDKECTKVAKDIDGKKCVAVTDENGIADFNVLYINEQSTFYAKETKAPNGYYICNDVFEITPTKNRESKGVCLIKISVLDQIIIIPPAPPWVIPPKTGDSTPIIVLAVLLVIGFTGATVLIATMSKKKKEDGESDSTDDSSEVDIDATDVVSDVVEDVTSVAYDDEVLGE